MLNQKVGRSMKSDKAVNANKDSSKSYSSESDPKEAKPGETNSTETELSEAELTRLAALKKLHILDSPFEALFDNITSIASTICETPISLISLVDRDRQWFKSAHGLEFVRETPREHAFCAHTILSEDILEVVDALVDDRFKDNPLVTGSPDIRFYAGAPITMPLGERIGTLCVIDTTTKELSDVQRKALEGLAKLVAQSLTMRYNLLKQLDPSLEYDLDFLS